MKELTPEEKLEQAKRESFVAGYVAACCEWTSGQLPAATLAYKAYNAYQKVKHATP